MTGTLLLHFYILLVVLADDVTKSRLSAQSYCLAGPVSALSCAQDHSLIQIRDRKNQVGQPHLNTALVEEPDFETTIVSFPWKVGATPLASCKTINRDTPSEADENLKKAAQTFCHAGLGKLVEFYVDPAFQANYVRLVDADGWIPEAFLTYMYAKDEKANVAAEEDLLVRSVHHFSTRPIVVTLFGYRIPESFSPEKFPNLVVMQSRDCRDVTGKSFNFNKLTSMLFTKVRTGLVLDADQFVNAGIDTMFPRIAQEITKDYPYAIMPAHWMSRDPTAKDMILAQREYAFNFVSYEAPAVTMHWGHAHPTWTHYALPWLATWTSYALQPDLAPTWLQVQGHLEDEDILNIASWAHKATKQWCKFDITSPDDFQRYMMRYDDSPVDLDRPGYDGKWYPKGLAYMFFSAHDAKDPETSMHWLQQLWSDVKATEAPRRSIFYDSRWFDSAKELYSYDPELRCLA